MIIKIVKSNNLNLANYLINGTNNDRAKEKIQILDGDLNLTEKISNSLKYEDKHYHIVVSLKGKYDNETASKLYKDFKAQLLNAYREDEVNISSVLHQDSDNTHFHCMIPKKNLLTNTKLDLYFDKRDRRRFELIRDYLDVKYNLISPNDKELKPTQKIDAVTKNWKQDSEAIKTKKEKAKFEEEFLNHINSNLHNFSNHKEILEYIKESVDVEKFGYDYKKDKFYATIKHQSGTKQRIFSDLFNDGDSKYTLDSNNNKVYEKFDFEEYMFDFETADLSNDKLKKLRAELNKENKKYKKHIESRIGNTKIKALKKLNKHIEEPKEQLILKNEHTEPYPSFITQNKEYFEDLELLNKSDISQIATKFFDYKELKREDDYSIISNEKSNDIFVVFKDKNNYYNFINPLNNLGGSTIDFLVKSFYVPMVTHWIIKPIVEFVKQIEDLMSIILDVSLDILIPKLASMIESKMENKKLSKKESLSNDLSLNRDLKPY